MELASTTNLLIIDDDQSMVRLLGTLIQRALGDEITVETLTDPSDALSYLDQGGVDILLTDLDMPGISGLELMHAAKRRNNTTQVLFMTGESSGDALLQALEGGATDYLLKPVDHDLLVDLLRQAHQRHGRWRKALVDTLRQRREKKPASI